MKGSVKMVKWALALAIGLVVALAQASDLRPAAADPLFAQASDPVAVVDTFHAAGDDIAAALALLTDDVVIELRPPPPNTPGKWAGKEEARKFFEWKNAGKQRRVRAGDAQVEGNIASGNVGVESDMFTRLGLGTVGHTFRAEVVDGKLKSYLGQLDPKEQPRVAAALLAAQQGQPTDPASVVTTYIREYPGNAALELLSDDAVVRIVPPPPGTSGVWTGKEEIRTGLFAFAQSQNTRPEIIGSPVVEGNKVTVRVMVQTNDFRRLGVGPVEHTNEAVVESGKIKSFTSTMIPSERERVAAAARAAQPPAGMPRTGQDQLLLLSVLLTISALAVGAGLYGRVSARLT